MGITVRMDQFEWDRDKSDENERKHGIKFLEAMLVFLDPDRITTADPKHSFIEERWACVGKIGDQIVTVRYTYRSHNIRIFGAGFWRKGAREYEKKNKIKN
jgi:uncharacterized protein